MRPAISIEDLTFTYRGGDLPALQNIRSQVGEGSFVVLMGHGGAGKSTLCSALNGLVPKFFRGQYQGRVLVRGQEVARHKVSEMAGIIGMVFQDFEDQLFSTNVELEMAFGPENLRISRPEIESRVQHYLSFVGLEKLRRREPATLSGGQKQRLAIGSVLAMEPEVLVMDEPTTDLDPRGREEVLSAADRLRERKRTLLIVDHDPETAGNADRVWLMRGGQIVAEGRPGEILVDGSTLHSCGIKVPPLVDLFLAMDWPGRPFTVEEAIALLQKHNLARRREHKPAQFPPADSRGPFILQADGLGYIYPRHHSEALRRIDLGIREGEFLALLGQNGSGKTTLAKHFNGLLQPTHGQMLLRGRPTRGYPHRELARLVGYVFQNPDHQIFCNTVYDEVAFGLKMLGEGAKKIEQRVSESLEVVGLEGYEQKVPFALTKGERQRVAVASVLAIQPQVLVLDEPTTGLDDGQQLAMMEMLKHLHERGHTVIIITHSMEVAEKYAERTVVLKDGGILLDGPTRAVFAEEERLATASLRPTSLLRLSNWLGTKALTVGQMVQELQANHGS
jgi:energy-coupling factor transport system ATP-binding protein